MMILLVTSRFTYLRTENSRTEDKIIPECVGARRKYIRHFYAVIAQGG